ncbi:transmembrane E3 ubiquitin-protein ligase 1 [Phtheirospermum japonicum]|uniref:RING-type E3 ubiquitin transferase n=1 Tax=Phtheirospermum japonicum TaxID=374723 RepID=A0A830BQL0_9LAMI|nr:transmembrane E3 ubiquitin-protein ligase 1 [Phtheirospermum japonicum]
MKSLNFLSILFRILFGLLFVFVVIWPVNGLRPLRQRSRSWGEEWLPLGKEENELGPFSSWNITGTYRGNWKFLESKNSSSKFPDFTKSNGNSVLELISTPTKITGVHYVQGVIIFHDVFDNDKDVRGAQIRVEGVYIWPFRQLRMVVNSGKESEFGQEDDYLLSTPYHLIGVFSSQVFQESPRDKIWKRKHSPIYEMEKQCNIEIAAQISRVSSRKDGGEQDKYYLEGLMESPSVDDDVDCFSPMLLNATSVNTDIYYSKAINYTLMVTFISFLEVLMLIRQMEHSNTQSGTAKVSLLMIGHQAIMDAYICLLHLTAGILVESLFNAFATAAFFKFVVFSIFEMRYLLAIWKANRPANGENWDTMRRELSALYSRFYAILLGGILIMYEFHKFLRFILLLLHSFWIPQICINVIRDSRKPLHPHYILGMTITRIAIPLYVFGCPHNFMRIEPDRNWCICLALFMGLQVCILLLQHYFGARCFIPRQILPEKYSYYRRFHQGSNQAIDCVICMTTIELSQRSNDCMVTPCDHFFHPSCLQRWMDIKMECPTCRRPLPPS